MAFRLPPGLIAYGPYEARDDREVEEIESSLPPGTRMLVALVFPFRFPAFGWLADRANTAVRAISGLKPWDEYDRLVTADDVDPVWWVSYKSSPAFWGWIIMAIITALAGWAAVEIVRRFVYTVFGIGETPQPPARPDFLSFIFNLMPLMMLGAVFYLFWPMIKNFLRRE